MRFFFFFGKFGRVVIGVFEGDVISRFVVYIISFLGIADPSEPEWNDATAQRQVLSAGDSFYIPPGNIYRLVKFSKISMDNSCILFIYLFKLFKLFKLLYV